ncbi:MAG TPA: hypothetical protein PLX97_14525, partial [Gemmatales bacterium]|nr:hypothetical protein [Gemmatales bacterium]
DPKERPIMARYTTAKPRINSLKYLAGQRTNKDAEELFPFERELSRARVESGLSMLHDKDSSPDESGQLPSPKALGDQLLSLFGKEGTR